MLITRLVNFSKKESNFEYVEIISAAGTFATLSIILVMSVSALIWLFIPTIFYNLDLDAVIGIEVRPILLALGILTSIQIIVALFSAIIESSSRLDLAMKSQLLGPVIVSCILFSFYLFQIPLSATEYGILLCISASFDLCSLIIIKYMLVLSPIKLSYSQKCIYQIKSLIKSGIKLQAASLMGLFLDPLNKFLLSYFFGAHTVTAYDLAMKFIWGIQTLFSAAMRIFLHLSKESGLVVIKVFSQVLNYVLVPALAAHIIAAIFLAWMSKEWLEISNAAQLMIFFGVSTISNLCMIYITPLYISLIGRNDMKFILESQLRVAIANLFFSILLIPNFGLIGASVGLCIATIFNIFSINKRHKEIIGLSFELKIIFRGRIFSYLSMISMLIIVILMGNSFNFYTLVNLGLILLLAILLLREPIAIRAFKIIGFLK